MPTKPKATSGDPVDTVERGLFARFGLPSGIGLVMFIGTLWGAFLAGDAHWARASDLASMDARNAQQYAVTSTLLEINRLTSEVATLDARLSTVKDRLRITRREQRQTQATLVSIKEDEKEEGQIEQKIDAKQKLIDSLRIGK